MVNSQVSSMYTPELNAMKANQGAVDQTYQNEIGDVSGLAKGLANILSPIGGEVGDAYTGAANADAAYAKGFSDMLGHLGVTPGIGDVVYGLGGLFPGEALQREGAAFSSAADQLPQVASELGQEGIGKIGAEQTKADQTYAGKLATILGDEGKSRVTVQNDLLNGIRADERLGITEGNQKLAIDRLNNTIKNQNRNYGLSVNRYNLSAAKFSRQIFQQNRQYSMQMKRLGISETSLQLRVAQNAFKEANGGYTQKDITKFKELANSMANSDFHGATKYVSKNGVETPVSTGGIPYFQALGNQLKRGVPVQTALAALDAVYPQNAQPTPQALAQELGPLAPQSLQNTIQQMLAGSGSYGLGVQGPVEPAAIAAIKQTAFKMASAMGWGDNANLQALDQLWTRESGWNPNAVNGKSGANGIPQELGHQVPPGYATNPIVQVRWGLNYIKGRYGSPIAALQHENEKGWY